MFFLNFIFTMKKCYSSNIYIIIFNLDKRLLYTQFEYNIINKLSYINNITKHLFFNNYRVFNLYINIGEKKYNKILIYPYIDKDILFKDLYNVWISTNDTNFYIIITIV